jgi:hypothetical protein
MKMSASGGGGGDRLISLQESMIVISGVRNRDRETVEQCAALRLRSPYILFRYEPHSVFLEPIIRFRFKMRIPRTGPETFQKLLTPR